MLFLYWFDLVPTISAFGIFGLLRGRGLSGMFASYYFSISCSINKGYVSLLSLILPHRWQATSEVSLCLQKHPQLCQLSLTNRDDHIQLRLAYAPSQNIFDSCMFRDDPSAFILDSLNFVRIKYKSNVSWNNIKNMKKVLKIKVLLMQINYFLQQFEQMSSLIVSSKCIELESNNCGVVNIKNVKINSSSQLSPILFKVKTNMKELVDVRPSFGVLWPQNEKSTMLLNVKYSGSQQQIDKAKLMISWFSTEDKKQLENRKFNHEQFNLFFKNAKKIHEGSYLMPIIYKSSAQKQRIQLNRSQQAQSRQNEQFTQTTNQEEETKTAQKTQRQATKQNQNAFQSLSSELSSKSSTIKQKTVKPGYSLLFLLFAMIVAFLFGVSFGIKIQSYAQPYITQLQTKVSEAISKFTETISEPTKTSTNQSLQTPNAQEVKVQNAKEDDNQQKTIIENFSEQIQIIDL